MATIINLRAKAALSAWKIGFADCLIQLCPDMNPDAADEAADDEAAQWKDSEPGVLAVRWALRHGYLGTPAAKGGSDPRVA